MKTRWLLIAALLTVVVEPLLPLDRAHFMELNKKAREQAKQQDWKAMRETLIEIGKEMPAPTPIYLLRMASVETHLGHETEALQWLKKYADMGLKYDLAADDDLKPLLSESSVAKDAATGIERDMQERTRPVQRAEAVCVLPLPDLMPEDLTFDSAAGTFVVSSIQHHTLYRAKLPRLGEAECALEEIPLQDEARRWPVLAVSADRKRRLLWMTASAMPGFTGFPTQDEGKAALFAVDSATGKIVRRFDLRATGPAVLGDMSIAEDGTVYVSDSIGGGVYRVRGDISAALEKIGGDFFSPQTPVLAADGKRLFVADYAMGIGVIDLTQPQTPGPLNYLPHPESVAVTGLDGLYLSGNSLIGIQNGTQPERIMLFHLNAAQTAITSAEVIEQATPRLGDPTHVTQVNGWFYVTANVGWNKVDDHGRLKPGEHFTEPLMLRFPESPRPVVAPRNRLKPRRP